jgi:fatty-acyl-CoA synthase
MIIARPMFHSGGLIVESAPVLYKGGTIVIKRRFSPIEILETVQRYGVTILELPATVYQFMLNECPIESYNLSSLRCCFTGGERVPVHLLKELAKRGLVVSQIYGLTEASTLFWLPIEEAQEKMGSVGHPIFHGQVRIVDKEGNPVNEGQSGEVIVKGPIVMSGYWGRPDLTNEVIKDGWLHTGDLARVDEEGFVYIVDRSKDMFISGGENVYPAEIEKVLLSHPSVADAAVVGVDDRKWGEVGKAFVVPKGGSTVTKEELTAFLAESLAKYKIPKYIQFMDELPKTASGKIQKYLLKKEERGNPHG